MTPTALTSETDVAAPREFERRITQLCIAWARIQDGGESGSAQPFALKAGGLPQLIDDHKDTSAAALEEAKGLK